MPKSIEQLIRRGYWKEADDMSGGSAGDGETDDSSADDNNSGNDDASDGDENSDNDSANDKSSTSNKPTEKEAELLKEVMKKKESIKELKSKVNQLSDSLKMWDGLDVEDVKELVSQRKTAETKKLEEQGEWEKLKQQINDQNATLLAEKDTKIKELQDELSNYSSTVEKLTVGQAFDGSKFITEELTLTPRKARIIYGSHFDIENGTPVAYDKPRGSSDRTQLVDEVGDPLGFERALRKIVDADPDRDTLIRSKVRQGANSKTTTDKGPTKNKGTGIEKIRAALKEG